MFKEMDYEWKTRYLSSMSNSPNRTSGKRNKKRKKSTKTTKYIKKNPCSNPSCLNNHSLACANKMCRICCDGTGCGIHKKSIKFI